MTAARRKTPRKPVVTPSGPPTPEALALAEGGFLDIDGAVAFTSSSRTVIFDMLKAGEIPFTPWGSERRIPRNALVRLMASAMVGVSAGVSEPKPPSGSAS